MKSRARRTRGSADDFMIANERAGRFEGMRLGTGLRSASTPIDGTEGLQYPFDGCGLAPIVFS